MRSYGLCASVALTVVFALRSPAFADDGAWQYRVDIVTVTGVLGYQPGKVLADDGDGTFIASEEQRGRTGVRGRLTVVGRWLEFNIDPYTVIPAEQVRVNLAGIETSLLAPVAPRTKIGLYHHSAHNFSDSRYGWGINLNAIVLDVLAVDGDAELFGDKGRFNLRFLGHWYWSQSASPYRMTETTSVAAAAIGTTAWKAGVLFEGTHPGGAAECSVDVTASGDWVPASANATCALTFRIGERFFGELGKHLYAGPFVNYGINFTRAEEFGRHAGVGGIRVDLLFADTRATSLRGL